MELNYSFSDVARGVSHFTIKNNWGNNKVLNPAKLQDKFIGVAQKSLYLT